MLQPENSNEKKLMQPNRNVPFKLIEISPTILLAFFLLGSSSALFAFSTKSFSEAGRVVIPLTSAGVTLLKKDFQGTAQLTL